jgi:hypothetical protein
VELAGGRHGLDPSGPYLGGEVEGADGFAKECSFFVLRLGQGDFDVRTEQRDGEAGKAGAGAEVQEGGGVEVEVTGGEEAFTEVALDDLFRLADGCEVGAGVPLKEKVEVSGELGKESRGDFG